MRFAFASLTLLLAFTAFRPVASQPAPDLERQYRDTVQPFLQTYCVSCHGATKPKAGLDLSAVTDHRHWQAVREQLEAEAMPPQKAKQHPTDAARKEVIAWIKAARRAEAKRTAGDPGPVPARRLSNAEYDYTIRDLTGADIRPAKDFPVDPANESGFDNTAESLTMSPALVKKYLEAARLVADHLVLLPEGFTFAPHPAITDTDRDKYVVRRVIDFYQRQRTDYADYFYAAWRFKHRTNPNATLSDFATDAGISAKYLATIWAVMTEKPEEVGPIAALQAQWKQLPDATKPDVARTDCERMRDFVTQFRKQLVPDVKNLTAPGVGNGSQTLVLWKNRQFVANRMRYAGGAARFKIAGLSVPFDKRIEATFQRFCEVFPDAFYVSERARVFLDPESEKKLTGRLLSAGFHSMTGYFRDDGPLYELILDDAGRKELDRLWREFDFINGAPMRQYTSFIWFERAESGYFRDAEFDFARSEDKDATSEAKIMQLEKVYLAKAVRRGASETAQQAMRDYFAGISKSIRQVERDRATAEPSHLTALAAFAEKAYRRPLTKAERDDLLAFYRTLRAKDGFSHEDAIRESVVGVLMAPHFCYRIDALGTGKGTQPLTDYALASRLSYFLWASLPDAELLRHAATGDLRKPEVLIGQTRRMLKDDRARGLAVEFAGNWLDFRRFEEHNAVDRERFPTFTNELRAAMFEEPVRFFLDVAREDRSVLNFLHADYTFVNLVLARHYSMPAPKAGWEKVDAKQYGRGGLLPMAVFQTRNAPGLRTSPVKRGYWVVRRLLGEHIPAPPNEVPELPKDEAELGERTLREVLARHRADKSCASCHDRFDGIGVAFEGYGPVGELRAKDLGGRPVEPRATFPGGAEGTGLDGLRDYLRDRRQDEFVENLCRKLVAYALGRGLQPSDDLLVEELRTKLAANGYKFGTLVEGIVTSPQFRNRKGDSDAK